MRKATFAKLSLTAAVGLGTLFASAGLAQAQPPQQGTLVLDQSGDTIDDFGPAPTTPKPPFTFPAEEVDPTDDAPNADLPLAPAPPKKPADGPEADAPTDDVEIDHDWEDNCPIPRPDGPLRIVEDPCLPDGCPIPRPDGPVQAVVADPCLPGDDCTDDEIARHGGDENDPCEDPCEERPQHQPRDAELEDCDEDDPCLPPTHAPRDGDEDPCDEGTTGGDDGGTDGHAGRLPHTGAEMATWAFAGLGLTGVGAALKRLGRKESDESEES